MEAINTLLLPIEGIFHCARLQIQMNFAWWENIGIMASNESTSNKEREVTVIKDFVKCYKDASLADPQGEISTRAPINIHEVWN